MTPKAKELLREVNELTAEIAAGHPDPYEASVTAGSIAFQGVTNDATCASLWLVWSLLQDTHEAGGWPIEKTNREMRRFATEWLQIAGEETKHRTFLDRWLYDELGYGGRDHTRARPSGD